MIFLSYLKTCNAPAQLKEYFNINCCCHRGENLEEVNLPKSDRKHDQMMSINGIITTISSKKYLVIKYIFFPNMQKKIICFRMLPTRFSKINTENDAKNHIDFFLPQLIEKCY